MTEKQDLWKHIEIGVTATVRVLQKRGKPFTDKEKQDIVARLRPQLLDGFATMFQEVNITREEAIVGITRLVERAMA